MIRGAALAAAAALLLSGCFLFDNPYDTGSMPTATFQVVVTGPSLAGTYVWSSPDNAYRTVIGGTPYFVYLDSITGTWGVKWSVSPNAWSTSPVFGALPATLGSNWLPVNEISSVDNSAGGISVQGSQPDTPVSLALSPILQVRFLSSPGSGATFQWVNANTPTGTALSILGSSSTYAVMPGDYHKWIRVVVTPTDGTGVVAGSPVTSPPVYVSS